MKYENMEKGIELYNNAKKFKTELVNQKAELAALEKETKTLADKITSAKSEIEFTQELLDASVKALNELD